MKTKTKTKCWLVNPSKSGIWVVIKAFQDKINNKLSNQLCCKQWHIASTVTEWFKAIETKETCKFIIFDTAEFCPSVSTKLPKKSVNFVGSIIEIEDIVNQITQHTRQSFFFHNCKQVIK